MSTSGAERTEAGEQEFPLFIDEQVKVNKLSA